MDFTLKLILINRLILNQYPDSMGMKEFYTIEDEAITWIHAEMLEPTTNQLTDENLVYQEELKENTIRPLLGLLLTRMDAGWNLWANWVAGNYSNVVWQDVYEQAQNEDLKADLVSEKIQLETELAALNSRLTELEAIAEPSEDDTVEIADLGTTLIPNKEIEITEKQTDIDTVPVIIIQDKPTWEEVKLGYDIYEAELIALVNKRLAEEAEYLTVNIDIVVADLVGLECVINKTGNHWDDVEFRTDHTKPSWEAIKTHWEAMSNDLNLENQLTEIDKTMDVNIFTQAAQLFGTTKFESMVFFSQSWTLKRDYASMYIDDGLTVFRTTLNFPVLGNPLNTEENVRNYYGELCKEILVALDKYRDNEIQAYLIQKATLQS